MPKIDLAVSVNDRIVPGVRDVTVSYSLDQPAARLAFSVENAVSWIGKNQRLDIRGGFAGAAGLLGIGFITTTQDTYDTANCENPYSYSGTNNGMLVTYSYPGDGTSELDKDYSGQTDQAIVQNLVESMGISSSLTSIEGKGRTLGTVKPVIFEKGAVPWSLIQRIDEAVGYLTYWGPDNVARRREWFGIPTQTGAITIEEGDNLRSFSLMTTSEGIANKIVVRGVYTDTVEIIATAFAENPLVPNPPRYFVHEVNNDLLETLPHANEHANYVLNRMNREVRNYAVTVAGDPRYVPGMTVNLVIPSRGIEETFFIQSVSHQITLDENRDGDFATSLILIGGYASDILIPSLPPTCFLTLKAFQEYEVGVGPISVVIADASGSFSPSGQVVSYEWEVDPAGTPATATTTMPVFTSRIAGSPGSITVTLTITDSAAETATTTQTITVPITGLPSETIWLAMSNRVRCTVNGGSSWNEFDTTSHGDPICLAPRSGTWGQVWGCSNGKLIVSSDYLAADPVVLTTGVSDPIRAVWITEGVDDRIWCLTDAGDVLFSADRAVSFSVVGTIENSGQAHWIQEDYGGNGTITVCYGSGVYRSYDSGTTFELLAEFSGGAAMALAFGYGKYYAIGTTSPKIVELEDTDPTLDAGAGQLSAITLGVRQQYILVGDTEGDVFRSGPALDHLDFVGSTSGTINHLVRSGNEEGVIYAATSEGFEKSVDFGETWFLSADFSGQAVRMIGYGDVRSPELGDLRAYAGCNEGLFVTDTEASAWTQLTIPAFIGSEGKRVYYVWTKPGDANTVLFCTNHAMRCVSGILRPKDSAGTSPLWFSTNGGSTWTELIIKFPSGWTDRDVVPAFSPLPWDGANPNQFLMSFHTASSTVPFPGYAHSRPIVFRCALTLQGDSSHVVARYDFTDFGTPTLGVYENLVLHGTLGADFVGHVSANVANDPYTPVYWNGSSNTLVLGTLNSAGSHTMQLTDPGTRVSFSSWSWYQENFNYKYSPDYKTTGYSDPTTVIKGFILPMTHGVYSLYVHEGFRVIANPASASPVPVAVAGFPHSGPQRWAMDEFRDVILIQSLNNDFCIYNGETFETLPRLDNGVIPPVIRWIALGYTRGGE